MIKLACCLTNAPYGVTAARSSHQQVYTKDGTEVCLLLRRVCSQHGQALLAFNIYD